MLQFLVIEKLELDKELDLDTHWPKMLDPNPHKKPMRINNSDTKI